MTVAMDDHVIEWLLRGDPAIRWQVFADLLAADAATVAAEQARVATEGWGKRLLARQQSSGRWAATPGPGRYRGIYSPKWTSTTYTLLLLRRLGLPADNQAARAGCRELVDCAEWFASGGLGYFVSRRTAEPCVSSIVLSILEAFAYDAPPRDRLARYLVTTQMPDGGWNCEVGAHHASFHTTIAALEALQTRRSRGIAKVRERAREFLLQHRLYRSHRTGEVVSQAMTRFPLPLSWHYDILRALEHFAAAGAPRDPRLQDAIDLVHKRRRADGRWAAHAPANGATYFALEKRGAPSRWTTLRWWQA